MDPFVVLAKHTVSSQTDDLGHSALPHAPVRPYVPRRRLRNWLQWRRGPARAGRAVTTPADRRFRPLLSPEVMTDGRR